MLIVTALIYVWLFYLWIRCPFAHTHIHKCQGLGVALSSVSCVHHLWVQNVVQLMLPLTAPTVKRKDDQKVSVLSLFYVLQNKSHTWFTYISIQFSALCTNALTSPSQSSITNFFVLVWDHFSYATWNWAWKQVDGNAPNGSAPFKRLNKPWRCDREPAWTPRTLKPKHINGVYLWKCIQQSSLLQYSENKTEKTK